MFKSLLKLSIFGQSDRDHERRNLGASNLKQSGLTIYDNFLVSQSDLMAPQPI